MNFINVFDGNSTVSLSDGAIYSLVAIVVVFAILLMIIGITSLIFKLINMWETKTGLTFGKKVKKVKVGEKVALKDVTDEDMMVAVIAASIVGREDMKKNVKVVSIREIK
jgi:Na+-transporting methylmalonyl-CoA/oxaloacetate decarboxylase gamma subunit